MLTQTIREIDVPRQLLTNLLPSAVGELVRRRLCGSSYVPLHAIKCDYVDGTVTLRGRVPSYFLKQTAQESVRGVRGVETIINQIEVAERGPHRTAQRVESAEASAR